MGGRRRRRWENPRFISEQKHPKTPLQVEDTMEESCKSRVPIRKGERQWIHPTDIFGASISTDEDRFRAWCTVTRRK
jgi:hypothetical protein